MSQKFDFATHKK